MNDEIKKTIDKFEKFNNIKISDYYFEDKMKKRLVLKDCYIGEDIFEKNIQEWLEICDDELDRECLLNLLKQYLYFPEDRFREGIDKIIQKLKEDEVNIGNTLFVTFPSRKGVASGGAFITAALTLSIMYLNQKENIITDVEKATEELMDRINTIECIVFVDDVIGSGKTLYANVSDFLLKFNFDEDVIFYIASICGREQKIKDKIKELRKKFGKELKQINLYSLEKSIDEKRVVDNDGKQRIQRIEALIEEKALYDRDKTFVMGFERNQLLVSFYYNTPNNTLSLFWRPSEISVPLFCRTSYKRPSISDCKANKEKMKRNAYERGRMRNYVINDTDNNPFVY